MIHKRLKLGALLMLGLGLTGLQAQESVNATGGNAQGSGGSVSYSVGQLFYLIITGETGSVSEGVQQPYEISVVTAVVEAGGIDRDVFELFLTSGVYLAYGKRFLKPEQLDSVPVEQFLRNC